MSSAPDVIAGRYRIEHEVGRGGMGSVYLARDERLDRAVAVKQVGAMPGESAPDLARALREARSSAALNHRNVVAVYDAIEEHGHIWLVMEYVPSRTLSRLVAEEGPLSPERAAWIGAQVADGLAAAHAAGTVHRDVKPGNILVTDDDTAKISDFGIARTLGDMKLTQTGLMTGTPAYFSPELARGEDPSPAADVWALGATMYAAVEGRTPYPDKTNALAMLVSISQGPPSRPDKAGVLAEPIRRMMDPDPTSRWAMADCSHALHRIRAQRGHTTREETAAFASSPQPAPPAVTEPVVTPDPIPTPAPTPTPSDAPVSAAPARERRRGVPALLIGAAVLVAFVIGAIALLGQQDDQPEPAANSTSQSPTAKKTDKKTDQQTDESAASETTLEATEESTPDSSPVVQTTDTSAFAESYYAALPGDPETGWRQLTESYQQQTGSYDDYAAFWDGIDAVSVEDTSPVGPKAVDVTLIYTTDGSSQQEVRRLDLVRSGDGYLISGSQIVG